MSTLRAEDFLQSLGVNTHIGAPSTSYGLIPAVESELSYLGIDHVRDVLSQSDLPAVEQLASQGIKFDFIYDGYGDFSWQVSQYAALAASVAAIEGPNEPNISPLTYAGLSGVAAVDALQADLYKAVHASSALNGNDHSTPVINFSLGGLTPAQIATYGDMAAYSDYTNVHAYVPDGMPPFWVLPPAASGAAADSPGKPPIVTETGFYTLAAGQTDTGWGGVSQDVETRYLLDTVMDSALNGIAGTYIYQLEDGVADPSNPEANLGLYTADHQPKEAAVALHNLSTILTDPNSTARSFTPGTLDYQVTGLPWYGFQTVMQESDGSFVIAIWAEPSIWDSGSDKYVPPVPASVTVNLGQTPGLEQIFDPMIGTVPINTYNSAKQLTVSITDHPILIRITPSASASVVIGNGPDQLVLKLSENAFSNGDGSDAKGDATFTVSIDGKQQGGLFTALAAHSANVDQSFIFNGYFGPGTHTVQVTFINDEAGIDGRSLYVDAVDYLGKDTAQNWVIISGSHVFAVNGGTTQPAPSADNTVVLAGSGGVILDASLNTWTITGSGQVAINGVVNPVAANIKVLAYVKGLVWAENTTGFWYYKASPTDAWGPGDGTTTSPLPAPSPNDKVVFAGNESAIVDASLDRWTITGSGQVAINGVVDPATANVTVLAYVKGLVWAENTTGFWYYKASPTDAWGPGDGTTTSPLPAPSPNDTVVFVGNESAIVDASLDRWTITGSGQVAINGVVDPVAANVTVLAYEKSLVWAENTSGFWYYKNPPKAAWGPGDGTRTSPVLGATPVNPIASSISVISINGNVTNIDSGSARAVTAGTDTFSLLGNGAANAVLGTTVETIRFHHMSKITLTGGTGSTAITADGGANSFTVGKGAMEAAGGGGVDSYSMHVGGGALTLTDFSPAKGDVLNLDLSLKTAMQVGSDGNGGTTLSFGGVAGVIDLKVVATVPVNALHWA